MTSKVEAIVREQMDQYPVQRVSGGYKIDEPMITSWLRFLPATGGDDQFRVVSIAEIATQFSADQTQQPSDDYIAVLNSQSVYGAYCRQNETLWARAQFTIYAEEPAFEFAAEQILQAYSYQYAIGWSTVLAMQSDELFRQQRAFQECPRSWRNMPDPEEFRSTAELLNSRGFVSTAGDEAVTVEVILSGTSPSRMLDRSADTALIGVKTYAPHPLAGVGYLATIALPVDPPRSKISSICARLNEFELEQSDFVPRLGAWGVRGAGDELVYSLFIPKDQALPGLLRTIIWWMITRVNWLRDSYWVPGFGLDLDRNKQGV